MELTNRQKGYQKLYEAADHAQEIDALARGAKGVHPDVRYTLIKEIKMRLSQCSTTIKEAEFLLYRADIEDNSKTNTRRKWWEFWEK